MTNSKRDTTDTKLRTPTAWRIVNHGVDHEQYFPGHGVAFTKWTACATGAGNTPGDALDDALEMLASDWDVSEIDASGAAKALGESTRDAHDDCEGCEDDPQGCPMHFYVSVDVK